MAGKGLPNHLPDGAKVLSPLRGDENAGVRDVPKNTPGSGQGGKHVLDALRCLASEITHRGDRTIDFEGARAREMHDAGTGCRQRRVCIARSLRESVRSDQRHVGHATTVAPLL